MCGAREAGVFREGENSGDESHHMEVNEAVSPGRANNPPSPPPSPSNDEENQNMAVRSEHDESEGSGDEESVDVTGSGQESGDLSADDEAEADGEVEAADNSFSGSEGESSTGETTETESEADSDERPTEPWRRSENAGPSGVAAEPESPSSSTQDDYPSTGPGLIDVPIRPDLRYPRNYDWISGNILGKYTLINPAINMEIFSDRLCGKSRGLWVAEGLERSGHAALWPQNSLKFIVYDCIVSTFNIRPPFTSFQQTMLATLGLAPSQLHPNGWAFMKAYELICLHLKRPVSVSLFLHLFEINRNNGGKANPGREHVSLRSVKNQRVFQLYSDSLKLEWKQRFYWVQPVDEFAVSKIGTYGPDGAGGTKVISSKFPLGWSETHYNRSPHSYKVKFDSLSAEDQETKRLLCRCVDLLPCYEGDKKGFPTLRLVHAATRSEVLRVLSMFIFPFKYSKTL